MLDPISAVTPRAVLRTAYIMPFMFGAAIALNACAEQSGVEQSGQSGNNPDIVSVSYTPDSAAYTADSDATSDATVRERTVRERATSRFPTSHEYLEEQLRFGSNGP
jgi:hypothetical protein